MSRYIWCPDCLENYERFEVEEADDYVTVARGPAVRNMLCDLCNRPLPTGSPASAVSLFDRYEDYAPWESEYVVETATESERPSCDPTHGEADGQSNRLEPAKVATPNETYALISTYTRSDAIADGVLVDVTPAASEAGFAIPVAVTHTAYAACVAVPPGVEGQDESGRLWDVLCMLRYAIRGRDNGRLSEVLYQLHVRNDNDEVTPPLVVLKAVCGPGDDGRPCLTIMRPDED